MATTTTTVTGQQSIPSELMPYFVGAGTPGSADYKPGLLPKAQEIYSRDYATVIGDQLAASGLGGAGRIAGLSGLEQQVGQELARMRTPGQFQTGTDLSTYAGRGQLGTVGQAAGYGQMGAGFGQAGYGIGQQGAGLAPLGVQIGQTGMGYGTQGVGLGQQAAGLAGLGTSLGMQGAGAGERYAQMATTPEMQQAYMSPYMQNVVDFQKQQAIRDYDIAAQTRKAQAVKAGAFGGSRQAIAEAEANRALMNQLGGIQATGLQEAFKQAQQAQQFGSDLALRGYQTGMQGLGAAQEAYRTGLQGTAQGMQGAQTGLQGLAAAQEAYRTGLQGSAQAMQGSQIGLQGVGAQQAGFAGANQAASTLGQLGTQQQAADMQRLQALSAQGATERGIYQQGLDTAYADFLRQISFPAEQLGGMANILRGVPTTQGSSTTAVTTPPPSLASQLAGAGLTGLSLYQMFK